jgi:hypothetical protein
MRKVNYIKIKGHDKKYTSRDGINENLEAHLNKFRAISTGQTTNVLGINFTSIEMNDVDGNTISHGSLYETDVNKCKRKEMGIVLKRRDNAPIVKDVYGGIIDILMKKQNVPEAISFLRGCLQNIVDEKFPIEKLIITKSLRSGYKNPKSIPCYVANHREKRHP